MATRLECRACRASPSCSPSFHMTAARLAWSFRLHRTMLSLHRRRDAIHVAVILSKAKDPMRTAFLWGPSAFDLRMTAGGMADRTSKALPPARHHVDPQRICIRPRPSVQIPANVIDAPCNHTNREDQDNDDDDDSLSPYQRSSPTRPVQAKPRLTPSPSTPATISTCAPIPTPPPPRPPFPGGVLEEERPPAPLDDPCLLMAPQWSRASAASRGGARLRVREYPNVNQRLRVLEPASRSPASPRGRLRWTSR
jgi:hypothetical protein